MSLPPGARLGPYELVAPLGAGGMGEVWRAKDPRLSRDVAVKVLPASFASDADRLRRLEQEARAAGQLNHPNVLTVFDVGSADGTTYVVSELLEGETLRQALEAGRPATRKALDWSVQIAAGPRGGPREGDCPPRPEARERLRHARRPDQDSRLRPGETQRSARRPIGVEPADGRGRDRRRGWSWEPSATWPRTGEGPAGRRAGGPLLLRRHALRDALGAPRVHRRLGGGHPVGHPARGPAESPRPNQAVPPGLDRIVRRCLEKAPEQRFQSAGDLAFALESLRRTRPLVGRARTGRARGVSRRVALIAVAAVLLVAAFFGGRLGRQTPAAPSLLFERLTSEPGIERSPALSRDGESVAYRRSSGTARTSSFSASEATSPSTSPPIHRPPTSTPSSRRTARSLRFTPPTKGSAASSRWAQTGNRFCARPAAATARSSPRTAKRSFSQRRRPAIRSRVWGRAASLRSKWPPGRRGQSSALTRWSQPCRRTATGLRSGDSLA